MFLCEFFLFCFCEIFLVVVFFGWLVLFSLLVFLFLGWIFFWFWGVVCVVLFFVFFLSF